MTKVYIAIQSLVLKEGYRSMLAQGDSAEEQSFIARLALKAKRVFHRIEPVKILVFGYLAIILTGALLLMLPFSSKDNVSTPFIDSLFTSCSATCVTGLVVFDTFTHWTVFGQLVLLCLIQIGGLGFMSMAIVIVTFTGKKIGYGQRILMQESISDPQVGGVVRMARFVISRALFVEVAGAVIISLSLIPQMGWKNGIFFSVFHSVSAFCNAGFDIFGKYGERSSLIHFNDDPIIIMTIALLIICGGLGFYVWDDIRTNRLHWKKYKLHSKLVLSTTAALIAAGTVLLFAIEYNSPAFKGMGVMQKLMNAFFMAVTPRTAGYNSVDTALMLEPSLLLTIVLMLIGGSSGSTAGGIKTTTFSVLITNFFVVSKRHTNLQAFRRRMDDSVLKNAVTIVSAYLVLFLFVSLAISVIENLPVIDCMYEAVSAIGTVGLTTGITGGLGVISKCLLIFLMYFGRVGCLTIIYAIRKNGGPELSKLPLEKVAVG